MCIPQDFLSEVTAGEATDIILWNVSFWRVTCKAGHTRPDVCMPYFASESDDSLGAHAYDTCK